jgi:hypothetical protein
MAASEIECVLPLQRSNVLLIRASKSRERLELQTFDVQLSTFDRTVVSTGSKMAASRIE